MATPDENKPLRIQGLPWQKPTLVSPEAQRTGATLANALSRPVNLQGKAPSATAPVPPVIGGATNMALLPAPPVTAPVAPPTPGASAGPPSPVPGATPVAPQASLLGAANYPNDNTISNLGDRAAVQDVANRTQGVLRATQGYQPISDAGSGGTMARTQGATTDYQTPQGSMTVQGGMLGASSRQGGGTLSVVGGRTSEEQAGIDERVASINRQTEALRQSNIDTGRSYAPGSFAAPAAEPVNLFARPGDGFGDSQMRQAKFESLVSEAGGLRGLGSRRKGERMLAAAQGMLAPGLGAAELQGKAQASRDSLMGQLTQAGAKQNAAQLSAQQKMQEAQQRLGLDTRKLDQEQQIKGGELSLNALKTFQGMGEAQQQQAKADLYNAYAVAVDKGDQATMTKLQPLMDYLYPQKQQNDTLAALLQNTQK